MKRYFVMFKSDRFEKNMWDIERQEYGSYDHDYGSASSIKTCKGYISRIKKLYATENPRDFRIYDSWADVDPVTDHVPYVYREE